MGKKESSSRADRYVSPSERLREDLCLGWQFSDLSFLAMGSGGNCCPAVQAKARPILEQVQGTYLNYWREQAQAGKSGRALACVRREVEACLEELDAMAKGYFGIEDLPVPVMDVPSVKRLEAEAPVSRVQSASRGVRKRAQAVLCANVSHPVPDAVSRAEQVQPPRSTVRAARPYLHMEGEDVCFRGLDNIQQLFADPETQAALAATEIGSW